MQVHGASFISIVDFIKALWLIFPYFVIIRWLVKPKWFKVISSHWYSAFTLVVAAIVVFYFKWVWRSVVWSYWAIFAGFFIVFIILLPKLILFKLCYISSVYAKRCIINFKQLCICLANVFEILRMVFTIFSDILTGGMKTIHKANVNDFTECSIWTC